jgi:hypothetical protein
MDKKDIGKLERGMIISFRLNPRDYPQDCTRIWHGQIKRVHASGFVVVNISEPVSIGQVLGIVEQGKPLDPQEQV